jgi:hypothetical protein
MVFPILGGNSAVAGYSIDNSLRFNDGDSPTLSITPASTGNRKTWTFSYWIKRSTISIVQQTFAVGTNATTPWFLNYINSDDTLHVWFHDGTNSYFSYGLNQLRDVSAWYHIMYVVDTTQSTASDRLKVYINGSEMTWNTYAPPTQNFDTQVNTTSTHYIGRAGNGQYFDGYIAETYFIDGQALTPTDFGEFDEDSGIWKPIEYTGTYGTNGFYLDFENSGSLGADQSGNGNNFTPTNLASTDQMIDTPTNNFPTINVLQNYNSQLISEGNTKFITTNNSSTHKQIGTTFGVDTGKWYWEVKGAVDGNNVLVGISSESVLNKPSNLTTGDGHVGDDPESWGYNSSTGSKVNNNSSSSYGNNWHTEIIGVALDLDNAKLYFSKSGVWQNSGDPESGSSGTGAISITSGLLYFPVTSGYDNGHGVLFNFGQDSSFAGNTTRQNNSDGNGYGDFYYAPPSGYLALCTQNLATELSPTIDDGSQYFNTVLWTGNNSNPRTITGVGFQSDFAWTKCRTNGSHHKLYDSSRGLNIANTLNSSGNDAEYSSTNGGVSGSDSDGFIVNAGSSNDNAVNDSAFTYVAWNWKANAGSTSSNTDGSITSTVQANTTAGFSIATFTGNGLTAQTIGHGLSQPTELYIWKRRDSAGNWGVETTVIDGTADFLSLNSTDAKVNSGTAGQYLPTSTTQYISFAGAGLNSNGGTYVCYSFHSVEGFSKIGSYTGNGSSDGPFVYTGFRPAWVMTKGASTAQAWSMRDNKRDSFNSAQKAIYANASNAESDNVNNSIDLLSNGFKIRNLFGTENQSGQTFIYMAFAENPFVSSTGVPVTAR